MAAFDVAFGGKADMAFAAHMSAFDPKRTSPQQKDAKRLFVVITKTSHRG
jgi:hypothetical protein